MQDGNICAELSTLEQARDRCMDQLRRLPAGSLRLTNPHTYKVSISHKLHQLRDSLIARHEP
jgi:nicotinate phosphoribosyltransferase